MGFFKQPQIIRVNERILLIFLFLLSISCKESSSEKDNSDAHDIQGDKPDIKLDVIDISYDQNKTDISSDENIPDVSSDIPVDKGKDIEPDEEDIFLGEAEEEIEEPIDIGPGTPKINVLPAIMDFGYLQYGGKLTLPVTIKNIGDGTLLLDKIVYLGGEDFEIDTGFEGVKKSENKIEFKFSPKKQIKAGEQFIVNVTFSPVLPKECSAIATFYSNDVEYSSGFKVTLLGNKKMPCISFSKDNINFGNLIVGESATENVTISSCSSLELEIYEVTLLNKAGNNFILDFSQFPNGTVPTKENPVKLTTGKSIVLGIKFNPVEASPLDENNKPLPWEDEVKIISNTFVGYDFIELSGTSFAQKCAIPVILSQQGDTLEPGTLISLSGENSYSPFGTITQYSWSVEQPAQSKGQFLPSTAVQKVTFTPFLSGNYKIKLLVNDSVGNSSCNAAVKEVTITEKVGMFIELLWETPGDTNLNDSGQGAGADLDLHFLHPMASDWYDLKLDCFWFNMTPEWGSPSPWIHDNPVMLNTSDDGRSEEIIFQEECEWLQKNPYEVGVHYYDAFGYGASKATLRIYKSGSILYDSGAVSLKHKDLWFVTKIFCDPFKTEVVNSITPNYVGM